MVGSSMDVEAARRGVAQRPDDRLGGSELGDAVGVSGLGERTGAGPHDEPLRHVRRGQRHGNDFERTAVEVQSAALDATDRRELVEQPGRNATGSVLGGLTQAGEGDRVAHVGAERQGAGDLEGGARRQAGAGWQVAANDAGEPGGRSQLCDDAGDVPRPLGLRRGWVVDIEGDDGVGLAGAREAHLAEGPITAPGDLDDPVDGDRKAEPAGVVGVVTDQVHPSRGTRRDARRPVAHCREYSVVDPRNGQIPSAAMSRLLVAATAAPLAFGVPFGVRSGDSRRGRSGRRRRSGGGVQRAAHRSRLDVDRAVHPVGAGGRGGDRVRSVPQWIRALPRLHRRALRRRDGEGVLAQLRARRQRADVDRIGW